MKRIPIAMLAAVLCAIDCPATTAPITPTPARPRRTAVPKPPPPAPVAARNSMSQLVRKLIAAPDSPVLHHELGVAYYQKGIYPQAEKECLTALQLARKFPRDGADQTLMAREYLRAVKSQRSPASEMKLLQDLHRANPKDAEINRWLVDAYLDKGDVNMARVLLTTNPAIKENADILVKWLGSAEGKTSGGREDMKRQSERFNDLATLMEVGSETHKTSAAGHILDLAAQLPLTTVSARDRQIAEKAFEHLKAAAGPDPGRSLTVHREYLALLEHWKSHGKALPLILEMLKKFDATRAEFSLHYFLAKIHADEGRTNDAIKSFRDAFRLGLEDGAARLMYGELLEKMGRPNDAINEYVTAMESVLPAPDRDRAAARVEKWLAAREARPKAFAVSDALVDRMAAVMPESRRAQVLWADILESRGKFAESYERYAAALKLEGDLGVAREGLARMAIRLGRASDVGVALQRLDAAQIRKLWEHSQSLPLGRRLMALGETNLIRRTAGPAERGGFATADQISIMAELSLAEGRPEDAVVLYSQLKLKRAFSELETQNDLLAKIQADRKKAETLFAAEAYSDALAIYARFSDSAAPQHILRRAACLAKLNRPKEAIDLLEKERMGLEFQIQRAALLVGLYEQTDNPQKAELVYRGLMHSDSRHLPLDAAKKLAVLLSSKERWSDALPILDRIVESPGLAASEKMAWIRGKIQTRNFAEADRMDRVLREVVVDSPDAYALLGQYEETLGNRGAAQAAYQLALNANSQNPDAALGLAGMWMADGEEGRALEALMRIDDKSRAVCRMMAQIHAKKSRWEMAAGWMEKGIEAERDRITTAWYWYRAGQIDEASKFAPKGGLFEAVIEAEAGRIDRLKKRDSRLLNLVLGESGDEGTVREKIQSGWIAAELAAARRRAESGDDEAGLKMCDQIIARTGAPEALYFKGITLLKLGLYGDARKSLEKAAESSDWSVPANLKLGQLAIIEGDPAGALRHLDRAGPGSDPQELILAWGMALALSKSPEQGEDILRQGARKSARGKFFLGRLLEQEGRTKEAGEIYKSLIKDREDFVPAHYRLGSLAMESKDPAAAEFSFSAILQNPAHAGAYLEIAAEKLKSIRQQTSGEEN